jgi:ABC-type transporter Mla MlaB component
MQQGLSEQMDNAVIELDLAKVAEMDGAGLQLLLTFWHAAAEFGCSVMLRNVLPSLRDKLLVLDVADRFTMIEDRGQA